MFLKSSGRHFMRYYDECLGFHTASPIDFLYAHDVLPMKNKAVFLHFDCFHRTASQMDVFTSKGETQTSPDHIVVRLCV